MQTNDQLDKILTKVGKLTDAAARRAEKKRGKATKGCMDNAAADDDDAASDDVVDVPDWASQVCLNVACFSIIVHRHLPFILYFICRALTVLQH